MSTVPTTPAEPDGYAYRYPHWDGSTFIDFNDGREVNGSRPIEAIPYWLGSPPASQASEPEWRGIDSAPKDRHVLLQVVTRWGKRSDVVWCSGYWMGDYWVIYNADEAVQRVEPSGWEPLPAPPQADASKEGS